VTWAGPEIQHNATSCYGRRSVRLCPRPDNIDLLNPVFELSGDWGFNPQFFDQPRTHRPSEPRGEGRFQAPILFEGTVHAINKYFSLLVYSMYVCTDGVVI
jgi:hypothetical protein